MRRDCSPRPLLSPRTDPPCPRESTLPETIFGFRDGIHGRLDGPISAMIGELNLDGDVKRPRSVGKAFLHDGKNERHQQLLATIAARLDRVRGGVRGGMTDTDFAQLVGDVARTAGRFAQIDAGPFRRALPALPTERTSDQ